MTRRGADGSSWLVVAAVLGVGHGGFSLYWGVGGTWLLATVGQAAEQFSGRLWVLVPVGLMKLTAGVGPWLLARRGWPLRTVSRMLCWLGALVLVGWGGLSAAVAQLVLAGAITPEDGYDRPSMLGHAWLWDPWFLLWGAALILGLLATGRPGARTRTRSG